MDNSDKRYRFYTDGKNKVVAVSSFAGKNVRGVAICSPHDEFDFEIGKQIAKARCDMKIAVKRMKRAESKVDEAYRNTIEADEIFYDMVNYRNDAAIQYARAVKTLERINHINRQMA